MWKIINAWRGVVPGDRYASDWHAGKPIPDSLVEFFQEKENAAFYETPTAAEPVTEELWTKAELKKANGAKLREIVADDPELEVEGIENVLVKDLRAAVLAHYYPE